jgi:outer membrane biosynthesis protein TonB
MPGRGGFLFSIALHLAVVALFFMHLHLFDEPLPEETPIAVELVNLAPETHATEKTETPPQPKQPEKLAQNEPAPKPEPPKPEPPKPPPPPTPPPSSTPPAPPPPPPPAPKPPEPKPAPPLPPPPKPEQKPQPPKKDNDASFDALLKNLAKREVAENERDEKAKPTPQASAASAQPIAPLGPQLTTSEIDLVREQIERCWNVPAGARDAENLRPEFRVYMNPDGTVRSAELMNTDQLSDSFFQAAADSARRALLNPTCQPLKLPLDKYNLWQTFTITFDPKDIT